MRNASKIPREFAVSKYIFIVTMGKLRRIKVPNCQQLHTKKCCLLIPLSIKVSVQNSDQKMNFLLTKKPNIIYNYITQTIEIFIKPFALSHNII